MDLTLKYLNHSRTLNENVTPPDWVTIISINCLIHSRYIRFIWQPEMTLSDGVLSRHWSPPDCHPSRTTKRPFIAFSWIEHINQARECRRMGSIFVWRIPKPGLVRLKSNR